MTISTVTNERLKEIIERRSPSLRWGEAELIGAELLAVREAQSGWTNNGQADAALVMLDRIDTLDADDDERIEEVKRIVRLLAAPPAPAVPDFGVLTKLIVGRLIDCGTANDDSIADAEVFVYNACRAAMLQSCDAVRDLSTPVDPQIAEYEQSVLRLSGNSEHVSQGYTFDGLNIRAVAALRSACSDQWLNSKVFADKVHWQNMHSIANEIMEAMAAAPTPSK